MDVLHSTLHQIAQKLANSAPLTLDDEEAIRLALRARVREDLFFFNKSIVGYPDLSPRLHGDLCALLQQNVEDGQSHEQLIIVPRQHLKTSNMLGFVLREICENPNQRVLLKTATATNSENWIVMLETQLLTNPLLRFVYPHVLPRDLNKVRWNRYGFELNRTEAWPECTVEAMGEGGTAVTRHYNLQIEDDMVNEDHLISTDQMGKVIDGHRRAVGLFVNPMRRRRVTIGNRWAFDDLTSHIQECEPWVQTYWRAALERAPVGHACEQDDLWPGLLPIWPERFTKKGLAEILEMQGPLIFSAQYMNDPCHDSAFAFDPAWFRYFEQLPLTALRYFTAVDPAISRKKSADFTAIVTVAIDHLYNLYVVDARHGRWGVDEFIDQLFEVVRTYKPIRVGLEAHAFQAVLQYPIREAMRREQFSFTITELMHGNAPKYSKLRIGGLHEYFNNGSLFLRNHQTDLLKQLKQVGGRVGHDDLPDALAYAVQLARAPSLAKSEDSNPLLLDNILLDLKKKHQEHNSIWTWHRPDRPVGVA